MEHTTPEDIISLVQRLKPTIFVEITEPSFKTLRQLKDDSGQYLCDILMDGTKKLLGYPVRFVSSVAGGEILRLAVKNEAQGAENFESSAAKVKAAYALLTDLAEYKEALGYVAGERNCLGLPDDLFDRQQGEKIAFIRGKISSVASEIMAF